MATAMQARRHRSNKKWRSLLTGLAFISPAIIGFLAFAAWPIVMSLYYSFTNYNVLQPPDFVGLDNYRDLFSDRLFHTSLLNTLYMVVIGLPIHLIFDFFMAKDAENSWESAIFVTMSLYLDFINFLTYALKFLAEILGKRD